MLDFPTFLSDRPFSFSSILIAVPARCRAIVLDSAAAMLPFGPCHRPMLSRGYSAHVVPMSSCFLGHRRCFSTNVPPPLLAVAPSSEIAPCTVRLCRAVVLPTPPSPSREPCVVVLLPAPCRAPRRRHHHRAYVV